MSSIRPLIISTLVLVTLVSGCKSDSPTSPPGQTPPEFPTGVTTTASMGSVTVSWDPRDGATGYVVFWNTTGAVDATDSSVEVATSPFVHDGLTNGTPYYYRVASKNEAGTGTLSGQVTGVPNAAQGIRLVACGNECSFLVDAAGNLYAWGANSDGQLGVGSWSQQLTPTRVYGISDVVAVSSAGSAGGNHTLALTGDGRLYAFGYNTNGELGTGDNQPRWSPALVDGPTNFESVAAGRLHSVGVTTDGKVYVWGDNTGGHLGLGYEGGSVYSPTLVLDTLFHLTGFVTAGDRSNYFKSYNGGTHSTSMYSWGYNGADQLGRGDSVDADTPSPISGSIEFEAASSRFRHVVSLTAGRSVLSWGDNSDGQLGREGLTGAPAIISSTAHFQAVAAGQVHSIALSVDGHVWGWGYNGSGQLGEENSPGGFIPRQMENLSNVTMIAAGGSHNLAVCNDGSVWAWGMNYNGQLGDNTVTGRYQPARVMGY